MASTPSKLSSTKDDATLDGNIAKHSSAYQNRRNSAYLENEAKAEKDLEKEIPAYDESKILEGRRLFFAFVAMLHSVLLFALGAFFLLSVHETSHFIFYSKTKRSLHLHCKD